MSFFLATSVPPIGYLQAGGGVDSNVGEAGEPSEWAFGEGRRGAGLSVILAETGVTSRNGFLRTLRFKVG